MNQPNIATIHGFEKEGDTHFLVMELAAGDLEHPISGTFPACTSSSSTPRVSSMGTLGSGFMELVEVDGVGPQAPKAVVDRTPHVVGVNATPFVIDLPCELGRNDDLASSFAEAATHEDFAVGVGAAVGIRGVEEVDTRVERGIDDSACSGLIEPTAKVVAPESNSRYFERAEPTRLQ